MSSIKKIRNSYLISVIKGLLILVAFLTLCLWLLKREGFTLPVLGMFLSILVGYIFRPYFDSVVDSINYFSGMEKKLENLINFSKGEKGEAKAYNDLKKYLPEKDYKIFRGFQLPNRKFDFDIIVVGIRGLIYFQIKNPKGKVILKDKKFFLCDKYGEINRPLISDPRKAINSQCEILKRHLDQEGYGNIRIYKALVFMKGYERIESPNFQEENIEEENIEEENIEEENIEEENEIEDISVLNGRDNTSLGHFTETREDQLSLQIINELSKIFVTK